MRVEGRDPRTHPKGKGIPLQLRCLLCDRRVEVDDERPLAKRAREQGAAFAFVCAECDRRLVAVHGRLGERPNPALGGRGFGRVFS